MANNLNPGTINIEMATQAIVNNGRGISERANSDGTTHYTVFSRDENRHLSYDVDKDGKYSNVHTDKNNHAYTDYKGGK